MLSGSGYAGGPFSQFSLLADDIRIPVYHAGKFRTGEFGTQAAELNAVAPATRVNGAPSGFSPFRYISICFDAALANPKFLFIAAGATLAASGDPA